MRKPSQMCTRNEIEFVEHATNKWKDFFFSFATVFSIDHEPN